MLALLALATATLSACTPTSEPEPTPTAAFASEEEAFAAAEETYRAYNDAVNRQREEGNPADPQDFLTGKALESDIEATRILEANDLDIQGNGEVASFHGTKVDMDTVPLQVSAGICLDVGATRLLDSHGSDVTPSNRTDLVPLDVDFILLEAGLTISASTESSTLEC